MIGVNCQSFLGEKDALIHYMDILEKIGELKDKKGGRPHVVPQIFSFFEDTNDFRSSVMEMLFFDSLIGNGDRHPQNWGMVLSYEQSGETSLLEFAPLYDHGNALSMDILEEKLHDYLRDKNKREKIIRKGKHHASWEKESIKKDTNHMRMCRLLWENYPDM